MTYGLWRSHRGSYVNRGLKKSVFLCSNVKTHLIDRRTRLKISSYKPGLKVLGEKITP